MQLLDDEGLLDSRWAVEEVVDLLSSLLSVDTYERLVVERGWAPDALIARVCSVSRASFLVEARPAEKKAKPRRGERC